MEKLQKIAIRSALNGLQEKIHQDAIDQGLWWELENYDYDDKNERYEARTMASRAIPVKINVCHDELSLALEAGLKKIPEQDKNHPAATEFGMRLAEAAMSLFDLAEACGCQLGPAILSKLKK
jgi:hypothetical protein